MKLLKESLSNEEKQVYISALEDCEDLEDLKDLVHEIYFYDKSLFVKINKFPKGASFEDVKANILKHLGGEQELTEKFSKKKIFSELDEMGGYVDYNGKVEYLMDEYGMSRDEAESYVWDWSIKMESFTEDWDTNDIEKRVRFLISDLNELEGDMSEFYVTWNFGEDENGDLTGGVDIRFNKDIKNDEKACSEICSKVEQIFKDNWFELDQRYTSGKDYFGSYHYQIIDERRIDDDSLTEDRSLAKPIKKDIKGVYKAFDRRRDYVRKENEKTIKKWNDMNDDIPMDDTAKNILLKPEPKFNYRFDNNLEREKYPFYVTYYEETPYYHPEEGGYYVAGRTATTSRGFDDKDEAIKFAAEMADYYGFEKLDDKHYHAGSKYIGDDDKICVETEKDYLSQEQGDSIYESLKEDSTGMSPKQRMDDWNRLIQICLNYDPFTEYIDNASQQREAEKANKKYDDEFNAIMKRHKIDSRGVPYSCKNQGRDTALALKKWVEVQTEGLNEELMLSESVLPYVKWVKRADDGKWVMWCGSYSKDLDPDFLNQINHPNFPNKKYNVENQYIDAIILPAGKEPLSEDTVKTSDGKWTNKGDEGTHGKFKTKKEADAQRRAMFANGYHESLDNEAVDPDDPEIFSPDYMYEVRGYFDSSFRGLDNLTRGDDWDYIVDYAHEWLQHGDHVIIKNRKTGKEIKLYPDEYDFDGEFPYQPEDLDESLKEAARFEFDNDFQNYNDFLADNFDGWSDDIDYLIKDLNRCARVLKTKADKLVFYKDYDEDFYAIDDIATVQDYIGEDYSLYDLSGTGIKFIVCVNFGTSFWIFKNEEEGNRVVNSVKSYVSSLNENFKLEGLVDISNDFIVARENWKKVVPNVDFDLALERWNKESKLAEPEHWYAKPIYSAKAWEDMVQMFSPKLDSVEDDSLEM